MPYNFATYGPFPLELKNGRLDASITIDLWKKLRTDQPGLENAIGIYILAIQQGKAAPKPWYVGKTDSGFKSRLTRRHKLFQSLSKAPSIGSVHIFFLARVTPKTKKFMKASDVRRKGLRSIDSLESMLIGSCLSQNENILNVKKMSLYKELHVPGYINDKSDVVGPSALALRKMLKER
jgi:hypothetical protein